MQAGRSLTSKCQSGSDTLGSWSILRLFMAVPTAAYDGILGEPLGKVVIEKLAIKLMVFDPIEERVTQWIR